MQSWENIFFYLDFYCNISWIRFNLVCCSAMQMMLVWPWCLHSVKLSENPLNWADSLVRQLVCLGTAAWTCPFSRNSFRFFSLAGKVLLASACPQSAWVFFQTCYIQLTSNGMVLITSLNDFLQYLSRGKVGWIQGPLRQWRWKLEIISVWAMNLSICCS